MDNFNLVTKNILNSYRLMVVCSLNNEPYIKFITSSNLEDFNNILDWWALVGEKDESHRVLSDEVEPRFNGSRVVDDIFLFYIDQDGGEWMLTND